MNHIPSHILTHYQKRKPRNFPEVKSRVNKFFMISVINLEHNGAINKFPSVVDNSSGRDHTQGLSASSYPVLYLCKQLEREKCISHWLPLSSITSFVFLAPLRSRFGDVSHILKEKDVEDEKRLSHNYFIIHLTLISIIVMKHTYGIIT